MYIKKISLQILLIVLSSMSVAFSQSNKPAYKISGKIEGRDTGWIYLIKPEDSTDSVRLKKGNFSFPVKSGEAAYILRLPDVQQRFSFFTGKGDVRISAHTDSLSKARITGSPLNEEFKDFNKTWDHIHSTAGVFFRMSDSIYKANGGKPDSINRKKLDIAYKDLNTFTQNLQDSFIRAHANSPVGAYVIDTRYAAYSDMEKVVEMFAVLEPGAKDSYYGKKLQVAVDLAARSAIGVVPHFQQADTSGKMVNLSDFRGKYVLVDFWASWCGPCRKENPNLVKAYNTYHGRGFDIVGISLDDKKAAWIKAIEQDGLTWTHVSDLKGWKNEVAVDFGISIVPTNFLVDKEGKIIAKNLRGEALEKKLAELLD